MTKTKSHIKVDKYKLLALHYIKLINSLKEDKDYNKLSLNVAKTKFMGFHASKKSVIYPELQINGNNIERVTQFNFFD